MSSYIIGNVRRMGLPGRDVKGPLNDEEKQTIGEILRRLAGIENLPAPLLDDINATLTALENNTLGVGPLMMSRMIDLFTNRVERVYEAVHGEKINVVVKTPADEKVLEKNDNHDMCRRIARMVVDEFLELYMTVVEDFEDELIDPREFCSAGSELRKKYERNLARMNRRFYRKHLSTLFPSTIARTIVARSSPACLSALVKAADRDESMLDAELAERQAKKERHQKKKERK